MSSRLPGILPAFKDDCAVRIAGGLPDGSGCALVRVSINASAGIGPALGTDASVERLMHDGEIVFYRVRD